MKERLKLVRTLAGLSQAKFADTLDVGQSNIKEIECGRVKIPIDLALKIEKKYNIDFKWLLTGIGEMNQESILDDFDLSPEEKKILINMLKNKKKKEALLTLLQ